MEGFKIIYSPEVLKNVINLKFFLKKKNFNLVHKRIGLVGPILIKKPSMMEDFEQLGSPYINGVRKSWKKSKVGAYSSVIRFKKFGGRISKHKP